MPVEVASRARIAWQDELWIGRTEGESMEWTQILGVEEVGMPEQVPEDVDVTHMQSPGGARETIPGVLPAVDYSQELQDWGDDEGFMVILEDLASLSAAQTPENIHLEFVVGGRRRANRARVNSFTPVGRVGEKRMATINFKIFDPVALTRVPEDD